jgi:hypothetical protein
MRNEMYVLALGRQPGCTMACLMVYEALVVRARYRPDDPDFGWAWPSVRQIAEDTGCAPSTVSQALKWLRRFIRVESRRRPDGSCASNKYHVVPDLPKPVPPKPLDDLAYDDLGDGPDPDLTPDDADLLDDEGPTTPVASVRGTPLRSTIEGPSGLPERVLRSTGEGSPGAHRGTLRPTGEQERIEDERIEKEQTHIPAARPPTKPGAGAPRPASRRARAGPSQADDQAFEDAWAAYPKRPNNSKAAARRAWEARRRAGERAEVMAAGIQRYAAYVEAEGIEPRFVKMAATFLGPDQHYLNDFTVTARARRAPRLTPSAEAEIDAEPIWLN